MIAKDLTAGTLAGFAGLIATHPLDTIRIRMQIQTYPKMYKTWVHWGVRAVQREGFRGLFKGVISNSCGFAPSFSICFASKEFWHRAMKPIQISEDWKSYISGWFAGFVWCSTWVPAELLKCRAQANKKEYINYTTAMKEILRESGPKGLYRGFWATVIRDVPCCGFWFWTYEYICRHYIKPDDSPSKVYTIKVIAGGLAGCMDWIPTYPIDVIKTKIQISKEEVPPSMWETSVKFYRLQGVRFFFKGIIPTCMVAFPCNAIVFVTYDEMMELFEKIGV